MKEMALAQAGDAAPPSVNPPKNTVTPPVTKGKRPVPAAAQQKEAEAAVRDVFKEEFVKSAPADKLLLAKKLVSQVTDNKDTPANQFALLNLAVTLAAEAADLDAMFKYSDKLANEFVVDLAAIQKAQLGAILASAAKSKDAALTKLATAFKTLIEAPDDPGANATVGKHHCFVKNDFAHGLPLLAKSNLPTLSKIAKDDVAKPTDGSAQIALGDAWWDEGEKAADKDEKRRCQERGAHWYKKALPTAVGLIKMRVEKRMADLKAPKPDPNVPASAFNPVGKWRKQDGGVLTLQNDHHLNFLESGGTWRMEGEKLIIDFEKFGHKEIVITNYNQFDEDGNTFTRIPESKQTANGTFLDLLTLLNAKRNAIKGVWSMGVGGLKCETAVAESRIQMPMVALHEYDFHFICARTSGTGDIGAIIVHPEGGQVLVSLAGTNNTRAGLSYILGKPPRKMRQTRAIVWR